ncbi:MAG: FixH family protein [Thermodesulfovibrionales bacterium]
MNLKRLAAATFMLLLVGNIAYAKDFEITKKAGEYSIVLKIDSNPPVVGDNNATVEIQDAAGKYVTDAKVVVDYSMPAMMGMPAMHYKADAELKGSEYKARMNLSMAGSWNVAVKIMRAGKTSTAKFTVDAK